MFLYVFVPLFIDACVTMGGQHVQKLPLFSQFTGKSWQTSKLHYKVLPSTSLVETGNGDT